MFRGLLHNSSDRFMATPFFAKHTAHKGTTRQAGSTVETIAGLARDGALHPIQEAFVKEGAMQCGYCVPGMIMTTVGFLRRNPEPTRTQIIEALNGNICRCCGYVNILKAVQRATHSKEAQ